MSGRLTGYTGGRTSLGFPVVEDIRNIGLAGVPRSGELTISRGNSRVSGRKFASPGTTELARRVLELAKKLRQGGGGLREGGSHSRGVEALAIIDISASRISAARIPPR